MVRSALVRSADAKTIADKWLAHNAFKGLMPDTVKYSDEQERDDHGRWVSSAGADSKVAEAMEHVINYEKNEEVTAPDSSMMQVGPTTNVTWYADYITPNGTKVNLYAYGNRSADRDANAVRTALKRNPEENPDSYYEGSWSFRVSAEISGKQIGEFEAYQQRDNRGSLNDTLGKPTNQIRINSIGVSKDYQRQGIASAMLGIARAMSPESMSVVHSESLTENGAAFASNAKADQPDSTKADSVDAVREWVRININFDNSPMERVLNQMWAASYLFGEKDAVNELTSNVGFDWDNWKPGNEAASLLVKPPKALKAILNKNKPMALEISRTTADRIGTKLSEGLEQGLGADEIARNINTVLNDPARSMVIARTETADALVQANLATYREAEVELVEWLVGDPCDICAENAGVQVRLGGVFPSGDEAPPAHPNCVCDVAPIVLTAEELQDMDLFDLAVKPDTLKYDPEQERDDHGRFGSGGSGDVVRDVSEIRAGVEANANEVMSSLNQKWQDARHEMDFFEFDEDTYEYGTEILPELQEQFDTLNGYIPNASEFNEAWVQSFEAVENYRSDAEQALLNGTPIGRDTLAGLELVNASPATENHTYRGGSFTDEQMQTFTAGAKIDLPFAAFTYSSAEASGFAIARDGGRSNPVMFRLDEGAKAIPMGALRPDAVIGEVVTSGRFEITEIVPNDKFTWVNIKQTGTFDTEGLKVK